jgi:intracellular sulfur oxidation DsrE/DsrF family protein
MNRLTIAAAGLATALLVSTVPRPAAADTASANGATAESGKAPLQIEHLTGLRVLIQVNSADVIPNGVSKQVFATKNLLDQYHALGMKPGKDFDVVMVFRADGAQFLLNDAAYDQKVKQPHPKGNPNRTIIDALHNGGVKIYECAVAMRMKGYVPSDILPYSRIVTSGIGALVDFEKAGYLPVTP